MLISATQCIEFDTKNGTSIVVFVSITTLEIDMLHALYVSVWLYVWPISHVI